MPITRRLFFPLVAATALLTRQAFGQAVEPGAAVGAHAAMPLREALLRRESIRMYTEAEIEETQLMALLWSANGINRPDVDGRAAPSWRTAKDIEIYVARASGVDRFVPAESRLETVSGEDIRKIASPQPFVGTAPVVLVYVSDRRRVLAAGGLADAGLDAETEDHRIAAHVNAAVIAQNVYLFCAAEGLGTCLVGGADRAAVAKALALTDEQRVAYVQPVGHPA